MNDLTVFEQKEVALIQQLVEFKKHQNEIELQEKQLKAQLKEAMEKYGIKSFKNDLITITYVDERESTSVDLKALMKAEPECYRGLLKDYPKVTKKSAYVSFLVK